MITLSEETKNPRRTVPLALLLSLAISTLLYVGVAIVTVSVLGVDGLVNSTRPIADVMSLRVGESSAKLMAAIALVSTSSTVLLASTGVAIGLILLEDISLLAGATDVLIYILFVIVNLVLIILRKRMPNHPRQFVVLGSIRGVPILPVLGIIATLSMGFNVKRDASLLAIFIVVVGIAIALLGSRKSVTYRYE